MIAQVLAVLEVRPSAVPIRAHGRSSITVIWRTANHSRPRFDATACSRRAPMSSASLAAPSRPPWSIGTSQVCVFAPRNNVSHQPRNLTPAANASRRSRPPRATSPSAGAATSRGDKLARRCWAPRPDGASILWDWGVAASGDGGRCERSWRRRFAHDRSHLAPRVSGARGGRGSQAQNLAQVFFGPAQCASASWRNASKSAACSVVGGGNGHLRGRPAPGRLPPQPPLRILAIAVDCLITAVGSQGDLPCALLLAWRKEMLSRRARNLMPLADVTGFLIHGRSSQ